MPPPPPPHTHTHTHTHTFSQERLGFSGVGKCINTTQFPANIFSKFLVEEKKIGGGGGGGERVFQK